MKNIRKLVVAALGIASLATLAGCESVKGAVYEKGNPVKIGLICLHDDKSTYDANFINGIKEAVANLGEKVSFDESCLLTGVNEDEACYNAAKDLVKKGCNVIFADSFGHQDFMLKAAKKWPTVTFCHATGTNAKTANLDNYHNAFASIYEGRYMAGYAAGLKLGFTHAETLTSTAEVKVGYVGAYPYAEVKSGYTSWFLGLRAALEENGFSGANVVMDVQFTNSWYYPEAEQSAAEALIKGGAVLISQHADSMGAPGACEKANIPNVTYNIETKAECPNTYVAYSRINWAPYYEEVVKSLYEGRAIQGEVNHNWTGTLATNSVQYNVNLDNLVKDQNVLFGLSKAAIETLLGSVEAGLRSGARKVFDCSQFTVKGEHLTSYKADTDGDFAKDTEAIVTKDGITYFDESVHCSAPYFDIDIDGINLPAAK